MGRVTRKGRWAGRLACTTAALAVVVVATLVACREETRAKEEPAGEGRQEFVIALLPEQNVFAQKKRYQPLAEYLTARLGVNVRFKLLDSYGAIFNELKEKKVGGAFFGSMNFVLANLQVGVEPLARPVWRNGESTYRGYLFTRRDSGLTADPGGWKGTRIALVSAYTTAGWIFPVAWLRNHKVPDFKAHFSKITFTGSHDAAALMVFNREAEVGACKDQLYDNLAARNPEFARSMTVLATSAAVPSNGLGVRRDIEPAFRARLRDALLGMERDPAAKVALETLEAVRFIDTTVKDYAPVFTMASEGGLDLRKYPISDDYVPFESPIPY